MQELEHRASVQSVGSSTRIEGSTLSDEEIDTLIKHLEVRKLGSLDEEEVAGYIHTLQIIIEGYASIPFTRSNVLALHKQMLQYAHQDERHRGAYKQHSNRVVARELDGSERTVFVTTPPMLVEREMESLFAWYEEQLVRSSYHPLVVIAAVVYEFLSIHPFQDGNGRLSRLITTWLLLRQGYDFVPYASFERVIERHKFKYYQALMNTQRYRGTEREILDTWTIFFLKSLLELTRDLEKAIAQARSGVVTDVQGLSELGKAGDSNAGEVELGRSPDADVVKEPRYAYLSVKEEHVLGYFDRHDYLSVSELDRLVPEVSRSSTKNYLRRLVETGHLRVRGRGRATVYERVC